MTVPQYDALLHAAKAAHEWLTEARETVVFDDSESRLVDLLGRVVGGSSRALATVAGRCVDLIEDLRADLPFEALDEILLTDLRIAVANSLESEEAQP